MARESFDRSLQKLQDETLVLGSMVEGAVRDSVDALIRRDLTTARNIYAYDQQVNENRYKIEEECLFLIATQQPMARDLRLLAAILEIITELERIGDYSKGICRINLFLGDAQDIESPSDIRQMAELGLDMLHRALGTFITWDAEAARSIPPEDSQMDALYNKIHHDLLAIMAKDPFEADRVNYLLWVAHNLERLADRVTNICERVVFMVTGETKELDHSDDEWDWVIPIGVKYHADD